MKGDSFDSFGSNRLLRVMCTESYHDDGGSAVIAYPYAVGSSGGVTRPPSVRMITNLRPGRTRTLITERLIDNHPISPETMSTRAERFEEQGRVRARTELECTCGLRLVAREEKLDPLLERLAAAGVSQVSLRALIRYIADS